MKIISNFKDYYDSIIGYGVDPTIQYKRFKNSVKLNSQSIVKFKHSPIQFHYDGEDIGIESFFVLFCNQLHIGYRVSKPKKNGMFNCEREMDIVYGIDEVKKFFSDIKEKKIKPYELKRWHTYLYFHDWKESIKKYEEKIKQTPLKDDWHLQYQSPVIIVDYDDTVGKSEGLKVICNPQLNKWKFQRVKDTYTTFQEIAMYMSNIFGYPGNEMVEVSEKTKIEKHGFDKWSFRKMPQTMKGQ